MGTSGTETECLREAGAEPASALPRFELNHKREAELLQLRQREPEEAALQSAECSVQEAHGLHGRAN